MRLRTFQGLRPAANCASDLCSPPYDVIDTDGAKAMAEGNPKSFLHVIKPEIDLADGISLYDDSVYAKAQENFERFQAEGWLVRDEKPSLYVYRQKVGDHAQHGIVGVCHVGDYENDIIKKHEKTLQTKEDDRTRHVKTLRANAGPVFLTFRDDAEVAKQIEATVGGTPVVDLMAEDGVQHTVWPISNPEAVTTRFDAIPCSYVADGHHRSASAARVGAELAAANPDHTGEEDYNWYLCVLFPADELKVLAYNRLVADLNGQDKAAYLQAVEAVFDVNEGGPAMPANKGNISMFLDGAWYTLQAKAVDQNDPVASLDVSILQHQLLTPILGIDDPRTNSRISFKGGHGSTDFLVAQVNAGKAAVAFSLYPTSIHDMMDVADADKIMPPKSTWFEPKLRSGMFVHTF